MTEMIPSTSAHFIDRGEDVIVAVLTEQIKASLNLRLRGKWRIQTAQRLILPKHFASLLIWIYAHEYSSLKGKALDNIDLNQISHRLVCSVLQND